LSAAIYAGDEAKVRGTPARDHGTRRDLQDSPSRPRLPTGGLATLPSTGTYTLAVDPTLDAVGNLTLSLTLSP